MPPCSNRPCPRKSSPSHGGLCRHCWDASHGRLAIGYTPRGPDTVRFCGLTLRRSTVAAIERAAERNGLAARAVLAAIVEAWASRRLWRLLSPAVALLALLLVSSMDCAPAKLQSPVLRGPVPKESLTSTELEQRGGVKRVIPPKPEDWQKKPPCSVDAGETEVSGACYVKVADRRPPCGPVLLEHGNGCYRAVAKPEKVPAVVEPGEK